jgi:prephenate dehydrogenase
MSDFLTTKNFSSEASSQCLKNHSLPSVKSPTVYYECFVDLVDETGGIAAVAGLLAQYHISIKNIGIVNNREFEEGVLQLAFPDKQTLTRAKRLLTDNGYMVHER